MNPLHVDVCVIGAGSGGLSVAAGAVQMGARVALIEKAKMGGDCLNYGCVPSKSLIAAARRAEVFSHSEAFGMKAVQPDVCYAQLKQHIDEVISSIEPHDSQERFERLGVKVFRKAAQFVDRNTLVCDGQSIKARRFVVATGSSPNVPAIPGLDSIDYLTNETIFSVDQKPDRLLVIGGGPIGCELAQAHALLGTSVTLITHSKLLPREDAQCVDVIRQRMLQAGIELHESVAVTRLSKHAQGMSVHYQSGEQETAIIGSHVLIAVGRKPNVEGLALEKAGVEYGSRGIPVDSRLRTSNKKIFAIGDVIGQHQFTHMANYHAGIVIRNVLFRQPAKVNYKAVPWVTYCEPELAHVGMNEAEAKQYDPGVQTLVFKCEDCDRARTERLTDGLIKVWVGKKGKILGVSIAAEHAAELLTPWTLAIQQGLSIRAIADMIVPYPAWSELSKRIAGLYYQPLLFSDKVKRLVKLLAKLPW